MQAPGGRSVFIFHVLHQNTLILPGREGKRVQKQSGSLGKGWGSVMPDSSGNVALGLSLPSTSTQGTGSAPIRTDLPVGMCQGFVMEPRSPLEDGAPPAPCPTPLLPFPLLPCAFIHFANSVCQIRLHGWLCSTCLFSMPARHSPALLVLQLRGGGGGGRAGVVGRETGAGCCFPSPYLFKA